MINVYMQLKLTKDIIFPNIQMEPEKNIKSYNCIIFYVQMSPMKHSCTLS